MVQTPSIIALRKPVFLGKMYAVSNSVQLILSMTLSPGVLLNNRYRIVSILGQGGMGAVYRAQDEHLDIPVAVKENLFLSEEYTRQFQREASILASLKHVNLPRVGDYFVVPSQGQYLIMDYVEGEDLRQRIERLSILPSQDVILIGIEMCNALDYMHRRKLSIVHRDIKPGNIKISPESDVYLVDFGLAKVMEGAQVTITGARAMTPGYSPPEQYGTARTDARTDIYSLGATLYAALTGVIPEDGLARATGKAQLTPLRQIQPKVDRRLAAVIEKCLAIEPEDRFQTAVELKRALIEAGNLPEATQQRPLVSPPPPNFDEDKAISENESPENLYGNHKKSRKRSPARRAWIFSIIALLAVLVVSAYYLKLPIPASLSGLLPQQLIVLAPTGSPQPQLDKTVVPSPIPVLLTATGTFETPPTSTSVAETPSIPIEATPVIVPNTPTVPQPTPLGGLPGEIVFVSKRTGTLQVWVMLSDGSHQRQLTNLSQGACQPHWSPDGKKLAVISPCYKKDLVYTDSKIFILDANGGNPQMLPVSQEGDFDPAWSPDGKRLAFSSIRTGVPHIFVYNFEENSLSELSDTRYPDIQPAWSPGGKQLAIARKNPYYHIWIISDLGQTQFQYSSSGNVNDLWPVWSHDNQFIMYSRSKENPFLPWLLKLNYADRGSGLETRIPKLGSPDDVPAIAEADLSPDQHWFVYEGWPDGNNHDIYLKLFDDEAAPIRLTTDPELDFDPVWKPSSSGN